MKLILKISRTELRNLFYSPVAWFLFIAFLIQSAFFYCRVVQELAKWQTLSLQNSPDFEGFNRSLTQLVFLNPDGIYSNAISNLYLFLPLLTMGIISREINNDTIKLLYSSPVKTRQVVLGKFLALMIFNLLLIAVLGIFMFMGFLNIKNVDSGILLSATLGFYLLICAFGAIGMFMSSLTNYQIVSAIGTFLVIFILNRISGLWQQYDVVRDLTYFLSMRSRAVKMLAGLITSADVIYYMLITSMFLCFTLIKLKGARATIPWYRKAFRYCAVIAAVLLIGYVSSRPGTILYWDTTHDKLLTIHPNTQQVISEFEKGEPLEVTLYSNLLDGVYSRTSPAARNDYMWRLWEKYLRFKPDIKFRYVYYYDVMDGDSLLFKRYPKKSLKEIAEIQAEGNETELSRFKTPDEIRKLIDLSPENKRAVMQLKYKGRTTWLRTFPDTDFWPNEMNVSAAFKRLQMKEMPRVLYTTGNLERDIYKGGEREFMTHSINKINRNSLINLGFDADTISVDLRDIPAGISSLVVADPKTTLSALKEERISRYLQNGGNAYIMGEPGKQEMLNPLLAGIGVKLEEGTLVQVSRHEMPHMLNTCFRPDLYFMADAPGYAKLRSRMNNPKYRDTVKAMTPGAVEVQPTGQTDFTFKPLLVTLSGTFNKMGRLVTDSVAPVFNAAGGDIQKTPFTVFASVTRKLTDKEQRILVAGDADYLSNVRVAGNMIPVSFFSWMDHNKFPVYTPRPDPIDQLFTVSGKAAKVQSVFFIWVLPAVLLLLGSIILIRRKRK
ncbi:ABC transporter permease subunit [Pseudoflavitalea sp. G-6-1-2]|uniref:Gldg family protein n=1 Tax=Pseudoflavitalea sp. G-6-1-2 TaxID=2728841 RepID=UPI00146F6990|nr:Gldg family protein [Pseudoflavitalea sp. G-6-1-2]NML22781.1 ABC transporter permease subunit [Pseudoflavitalea sp. G-6-1-2]